MQWIIPFRETSLTVACITAIVAQAMSQLTLNQSVGVFSGDLLYAQLGVAAGVLTILSIPLILLYDMAQEKSYSATVLFELVWNFALAVLWIVAGVKAMGVTSSDFKTCNFDVAALVGLCHFAQTLVPFAFISAAILLLYSAALGFVAVSSASSGNPIWTSYNVGGKKK